jgi:hypothetical protein
MTMTTTAPKWHRGAEPGEWYAEVDGETVARCGVRHGTPTGYWGRYAGHILGKRHFVTTLAEFKAIVRDALAARNAKAA